MFLATPVSPPTSQRSPGNDSDDSIRDWNNDSDDDISDCNNDMMILTMLFPAVATPVRPSHPPPHHQSVELHHPVGRIIIISDSSRTSNRLIYQYITIII